MAILPLQLARVSNTLRMNVATSTIARTQQQLLRVQNELSTGKRINSPSDDPGSAAIVQQIRKTLEQRLAYSFNLQQGLSHLGEVGSTMADMSDLLQQAQTLAQANVGSDVTPEQRDNAAMVVQALFNQMVLLGNKQFQGVYLFGGDRSNDPPFVEAGGGVRFAGSERVLLNRYDENSTLPFMVDGSELFGALSTRVRGEVDLSPSMTSTTRLADLRGSTGQGIRPGSIQLGNGSVSGVVDLSAADTVGNVMDLINSAGIGGITASIAADGVSLQLSGGAGENISVADVGGGLTAADLGILAPGGAGVGAPLNGASIRPILTPLTPIPSLRNGAGIDAASGITVTNGLITKSISFASAATVEDMLNLINSSGANVRAEINAAGTGINILNPTQGTAMTIAENGGSTAGDLGIRSFHAATPLAHLNGGKGVRTVDGADIVITDSVGTAYAVDLSNLTTTQDVIDAINAAAPTVTASFATTGNGLVLTDTAGGAGTLRVARANFSDALEDLGLDVSATTTTLAGRDVNPVQAPGIFANLAKLRHALREDDQSAITEAAEGLKADYDRAVRVRGETGARIQEMEARQNRLEDQNLASRALLSSMEDTDFTEAITRFQTLQNSLQATLMSSSKIMQMSLLDFLR
jgi:flagellar hook-associated protein 3 FlgL